MLLVVPLLLPPDSAAPHRLCSPLDADTMISCRRCYARTVVHETTNLGSLDVPPTLAPWGGRGWLREGPAWVPGYHKRGSRGHAE